MIPYVSDGALDLVDNPPLRVDVRSNGSTAGLYLASDTARSEPAGALRNPGGPGWVPLGDSEQVLILEGRRSGTVAITGLVAEMVERRPPMTGTFFGIPAQGEQENTILEVRLDDPQGVPLGRDGAPYFVAHHLELAKGELRVIRIRSWTNECFCSWRLRMTYHYRGADHILLLPAPDKAPFQTTAGAARPADYQVQYVWNSHGVLVRLDCRTNGTECAKTHVPSHPPVR
ncbi:hypothetical protein [Micromonospora inositola]|uniref:hypothetical protein n=1 Tax=Micromonospora inositola TaxID=47865 RepID=UPI0012FD3DF3|nr:hypothetical protein [Micromonospora inositola]